MVSVFEEIPGYLYAQRYDESSGYIDRPIVASEFFMDRKLQQVSSRKSVYVDEDECQQFEAQEVPYEDEYGAVAAENEKPLEPSVGNICAQYQYSDDSGHRADES